MPFAPHIILYLFIFPKILQERRTTLQHVIVRRIKIAGVPRIRNVPMTARKLKQLVHLAVRVALQHAMEIFHIPFVHADNIVCLLIILPGDLRSAVRQHRNADLSQLADSTVVWRVADLLRACGTGVDVELIGEVLFVDKVLENELARFYLLFRASYFSSLKLHFLQNNAKRGKSMPCVVVKS